MEMKKSLFLTLLVLLLTKSVFGQLPLGPRPAKDTVQYIGTFDVSLNDEKIDYDTHIFSTVDKPASYVGSVADFIHCLLQNLSEKVRNDFKDKQEWIAISFVVEKDSTLSDVQAWLSDDPIFLEQQSIWQISNIEGYPGWGKAFISGRNIQMWKSRNKRLNKDIKKFADQMRWIPAKKNGRAVRSYGYLQLPINLNRDK